MLNRTILKEHNFSPLSKKIPYYNKDKEKRESLELDQFAKKDNTYYFIEQKMRDDHDSAKKRGQIDNFEKKLRGFNPSLWRKHSRLFLLYR